MAQVFDIHSADSFNILQNHDSLGICIDTSSMGHIGNYSHYMGCDQSNYTTNTVVKCFSFMLDTDLRIDIWDISTANYKCTYFKPMDFIVQTM